MTEKINSVLSPILFDKDGWDALPEEIANHIIDVMTMKEVQMFFVKQTLQIDALFPMLDLESHSQEDQAEFFQMLYALKYRRNLLAHIVNFFNEQLAERKASLAANNEEEKQ